MDTRGEVLLERNTLANPKSFLKAVAPFREDLVVGCECIFMWYWLAYVYPKKKRATRHSRHDFIEAHVFHSNQCRAARFNYR